MRYANDESVPTKTVPAKNLIRLGISQPASSTAQTTNDAIPATWGEQKAPPVWQFGSVIWMYFNDRRGAMSRPDNLRFAAAGLFFLISWLVLRAASDGSLINHELATVCVFLSGVLVWIRFSRRGPCHQIVSGYETPDFPPVRQLAAAMATPRAVRPIHTLS